MPLPRHHTIRLYLLNQTAEAYLCVRRAAKLPKQKAMYLQRRRVRNVVLGELFNFSRYRTITLSVPHAFIHKYKLNHTATNGRRIET